MPSPYGNMTLGAAIQALEEGIRQMEEAGKDPGYIAFVDGTYPDYLHSYRGFYNELAIEPRNEPMRAVDFLAILRSAVGFSFPGYKGGEYRMGLDTPLWVSDYGVAEETVVLGMYIKNDMIQIATVQEEML